MKSMSMLIPLLLIAAAFILLAVPGLGKAVGQKLHDALFAHMARSGLVLGMAEINGRAAAEAAAGRKILPDSQGESARAVCEMPAVHAGAAIADTIGFGVVLKRGTRLLCPVTLSNGAGTASSTLAVGLRNPVTKVAIDATAILAATAINAAQTIQANTGTKLTNGQRYVLDQDAEIYGTVAGAAIPANQAIRIEVPYITA